MKHIIYKITNLINNKIYIGQTNNPKRRWRAHKSIAQKENPKMIINQAMKKYGIENFIFEIIAYCIDWDTANEIETLLVKQEESHISLGKGYNVSLGGFNAPWTEERKKMMHNMFVGKSTEPRSEETKYKISQSLLGNIPSNKGTHHTIEIKDKISKKLRGRKLSNEHKKKLSEIRKGKSNSGSFIKGQISPMKNKKHSEESKNKNRLAHLGKPTWNKIYFTNEQIENIKNDKRSSRIVAKDYGISKSMILKIKKS